MRPIFCIELCLISIIIILDYSSSIQMNANDQVSIHLLFCGEYRNNTDEIRNIQTSDRLYYDIAYGEKLCRRIGFHLYGEAQCSIIPRVNMTIASTEPENRPFKLIGQKCRCRNIMNLTLPEFCIKRTFHLATPELFVLKPHVLPEEQFSLYIYKETPLYADAYYVEGGLQGTFYHDTAPARVILRNENP